MEFVITFEHSESHTFPLMLRKMEAVLGRQLRPGEANRVYGHRFEYGSNTYVFDFELDQPHDCAINLDIMREFGLCGASKSDTELGGLTTPSISQPTIPEPTAEAPSPFDLYTPLLEGVDPEPLPEDSPWRLYSQNRTFILPRSTLTATWQTLTNSTGSAIYYSGSEPPIPVFTQDDEADTGTSISNP